MLQVYGRAPITAAICHLSGPAKKAASEAFEKVAASKGGAAALQGTGPASDSVQASGGSFTEHAGSRPPSRGATEAPVWIRLSTVWNVESSRTTLMQVTWEMRVREFCDALPEADPCV